MNSCDVSGNRMQRGLKGYIYGERGVWRPGDSLFLTFMLNDIANKLPKRHPVKLEITPEATPVETVEQRLYHIPNVQSKLNLLVELLKDIDEMHRVMIFVKSKHSANRIFDFLQSKDFNKHTAEIIFFS